MAKRFFTWILLVCMAISLLPVSTKAASTTVGNYATGLKTFTGMKAGQTHTVQARTYKKSMA